MNLDYFVQKRDQVLLESPEWHILNEEKAKYLESVKPSTRERIVYFEEKCFDSLVSVFTSDFAWWSLPFAVERRSILEYYPTRRHPIPYVVLKFQKQYFFILREKGGGELRLIGKKGLVGGHVGEEDLVEGDLRKTCEQALFRELYEEVGVDKSMIQGVRYCGVIKSDEGVDADHLGLVYQIDLNTADIKSAEKDILTGLWLSEDDLKKYYDSFENWTKIVCDYVLIQ